MDIIAISESWCSDDSINVNSVYQVPQVPNYILIHQIHKASKKGGKLALYIHKKYTFNTVENLSNNDKYIERPSVEIIKKNQNIILPCNYRLPRSNQNIFTVKMKDLIERYKQNQKSFVLVGDLNFKQQKIFNFAFLIFCFSCDILTN